jgi:hypothetical protein
MHMYKDVVIFINQSIDIHITYLFCEYQLIQFLTGRVMDILLLTNKNEEHAHA